jgi:hypothetical protein
MPDLPECSNGQERCSSCRLVRTPHMVRHACGFALANRGHDTRALQAYLGHRMLAYGRYTSCRRLVSRIFGANDCARTVSELLPNSAKLRQSADPRCCWQPRRKPPPRGTPAQPALRRMPKGSKGEVKPSREVTLRGTFFNLLTVMLGLSNWRPCESRRSRANVCPSAVDISHPSLSRGSTANWIDSI